MEDIARAAARQGSDSVEASDSGVRERQRGKGLLAKGGEKCRRLCSSVLADGTIRHCYASEERRWLADLFCHLHITLVQV